MPECRAQRRSRAACRNLVRLLAEQSPEQLEATRDKLEARVPADRTASVALKILGYVLEGRGERVVGAVDALTAQRPAPRTRTHA